MRLYADRPVHATNQLLGDALVVLWVAAWVVAATHVHDRVADLAGPGRDAEGAGRTLQHSLGQAAQNVGDVPLAGGALREPFDEGATSGRRLAEAAQAYQDVVGNLAMIAAVVTVAAPVILVLALWLPRRLAWVLDASAADRLLRSQGPAALDLFAVRALARQPVPRLVKVDPDPAGGWRGRDPGVVHALAGLELDRLGLRPGPRDRGGAR